MEKLIVGKIVKLHGIKGSVKVIPVIDENIKFSDLKGVFYENDNVFHEFEEVFAVSDQIGVKFKDCNSVDDASKLVGKFLFADKSYLESLVSEESFFIEDLKASKIYIDSLDGEFIGVLDEIDNYGSADVFYIKSEKYKNLTIPHVQGLIKLFDEKNKSIILNKDVFSEVAVYGD